MLQIRNKNFTITGNIYDVCRFKECTRCTWEMQILKNNWVAVLNVQEIMIDDHLFFSTSTLASYFQTDHQTHVK